MLLGNADRLPCEDLGWRGNLENVMYACAGTWEGRMVAIDAVVQRRPPGALHAEQVRRGGGGGKELLGWAGQGQGSGAGAAGSRLGTGALWQLGFTEE